MSKTVEAFNYRIGLDVSSLKSGTVLTKRELGFVRRDLSRLQQPAEKSAKQIDRLTRAHKAGALSASQYREALSRIKERSPEGRQATKEQAEAQRELAALRKEQLSEDELVRREGKRLIEWRKKNNASLGESAEMLRRYKDQLPSARKAAKELADAERESAAIRNDLKSDTDRYADEQRRLTRLVDKRTLSQDDADKALRRYRRTMPSVVRAEKDHADQLQRATALQNKYATSTERAARELAQERAELEKLRRAGLVDDKTYRRGRRDLAQRRLDSIGQQLAPIPGLGKAGAVLKSIHPAALAAAAGIGALATSYKLLNSAVATARKNIGKQTDKIIALEQKARSLGMSMRELTSLQMAISSTSGLDFEPSLDLIGDINVKIAETAYAGDNTVNILEQMGGALDELNKSGEAADALNLLGKSAEELMKLSPYERTREFIAAARDLNASQRAFVADEIGGDAGVAFAGTLAAGLDGLDAGIAKMKKYRQDLEDFEGAGVKQMASSLRLASLQWDGMWRQLTAEIAPAVSTIAFTVDDLLHGTFGVAGGFDGWSVKIVEATAGAAMLAAQIKSAAEMTFAIARADLGGFNRAVEAYNNADAAGAKIIANYRRAQTAALALAKQNRESLEAEKQALELSQRNQGELDSELGTLRQRNLELTQGVETAERLRIANAKASDFEKAEVLRLTEENKRLEAEAKAKEEAETKATQAAKQRRDQAVAEAEAIKEGQQSVMDQTVERYRRLNELRRMDLISEAQATEEKRRLASEAAQPPDLQTGTAVTDVAGVYAALVEDQSAQRSAELEREQTDRLRRRAEELAAIEQRRGAAVAEAAANYERQAAAAERVAAAGNVRFRIADAESTDDTGRDQFDYWQRIAEASERTADSVAAVDVVGI